MTNENMIPELQEVQTEKKEMGTGCLGQLGWFFSGAVLPMGSITFYRKAAQRSVGSAILFFLIFTVAISTLSTINVAVDMFSFIGSIQQAYANGDVPDITISQGIATVDGPQPFIMLDGADTNGESIIVATDTTGRMKEIDTSRYDQGFLLTRTELHMVTDQNGYQIFPLSDLNTSFEKDPIIINSETTSRAWGFISVIIVALAFIFLVLWYTVVRLMIISTIALVIWGIVSLIKPNTGFGPIIITGLYAIIPAIYFSYLLKRSGLAFPGLQTFFLLVFWVTGLVVNLMDIKFFNEERPLRLWTAAVGLPMLILFIVDLFAQFPSPYGPLALWGLTLLTWFILIGLRLYFRFKSQMREQPLTE